MAVNKNFYASFLAVKKFLYTKNNCLRYLLISTRTLSRLSPEKWLFTALFTYNSRCRNFVDLFFTRDVLFFTRYLPRKKCDQASCMYILLNSLLCCRVIFFTLVDTSRDTRIYFLNFLFWKNIFVVVSVRWKKSLGLVSFFHRIRSLFGRIVHYFTLRK